MNIKNYVNTLIKKHKSNNPYVIADNYCDIDIITYPLHESVRGMYYYYKRNRMIFLNDELDSYIQKVVCAHELGHALMHPKVNIKFLKNNTFLSANRFEKEANIFAAELLLPDNELMQYKEYTYQQIAAFENIPEELVRLKFRAYL